MNQPSRSLIFLAVRVANIARIASKVPVTPKMIARIVSSGTVGIKGLETAEEGG